MAPRFSARWFFTKDFWGLSGVGLALFTSMMGFAGLAALGWVEPNPRQPYLLLAVVGGTAFGAGMVLAGGCVSGSLYKAAEGRVNSMLALVGIAIGGALVSTEFVVPARVALSMFMADLGLPGSMIKPSRSPMVFRRPWWVWWGSYRCW